MGGKRGRSNLSSGQQERVRTHLFFSQQPERQHQKRKRRAQIKFTAHKLHQVTHKKDEMVQAGAGELDPSQWTGNQRVLHFGPMAQRDPYFYYYPKGWDILYPAHFGFFPYRTSLIYMGFHVMYDSPFWTWSSDRRLRPPPIQVAGPMLLFSGSLLVIIAVLYALITSSFFKLYLHHTKHHDEPARLTTITTMYQTSPPIFEKHPYQPLPPPAYPVLENKYAHSSIVRPHDEMKLYPPVYHSGVLDSHSVLENRRTGSIPHLESTVPLDSSASSGISVNPKKKFLLCCLASNEMHELSQLPMLFSESSCGAYFPSLRIFPISCNHLETVALSTPNCSASSSWVCDGFSSNNDFKASVFAVRGVTERCQ
uniref:Uncharacterized protein n=1 Tax=Heterorhabditis bacteriophora TaxID=37862 RepID=A0A1I7XA35_HETBA